MLFVRPLAGGSPTLRDRKMSEDIKNSVLIIKRVKFKATEINSGSMLN
jgi:hypothetical protein